MKNSNLVIKITAILFVFVSCTPIYKCGEAKPTKKTYWPKIIQNVIDERDRLCTTVSERDNEIGGLKTDIAKLNTRLTASMNEILALKADTALQNDKLKGLEKQYSDLSNQNLSQTELFNLEMKRKSDELKKKTDELKKKTDELKKNSDLLATKENELLEREKALKDLQKVISRQDSITNRLNNLLRNALLGFKSDELSVEIKNGKVYVSMSDKLLFKSGSAAIELKGVEAIKVLADVILKNTDVDILIEGHTDNIPIKTAIYSDNWDLSVARALSIVRILTNEYKVPATRLTASGKGEFSPRSPNTTPEGRASNRRTEIILSPKLDEIMKLLKN
jgi:chemotaxis protein MotB